MVLDILKKGGIEIAESRQGLELSDGQIADAESAYEFLRRWVSDNEDKLNRYTSTEVYGDLQHDFVYILRNVFDRVLTEEGYDPKSILSVLRRNGLLLTKGRGFTRQLRIKGEPMHCVVLKY